MKVLLDELNFVFIAYNMAQKQLKDNALMSGKITGAEPFILSEEDVPFCYHVLFNKFNHLFKTYGQVIICHEGKGSTDWRRNIFPEYKRNRDAGKAEDSYKILKATFPKIEEILNYYPTKQIKVDGCEADDCIFALSTYFANNGEEVLIISSDGDLAQTMNFSDKIQVYNPVKRTYHEKDPDLVMRKAIVGDASDNIPGLYRVGPKTFEKMMLDKALFAEKMKGENREIFERFKKIVDLSVFPKEKHEEIIKQYEEKPWNEFKIGLIESFYYDNKMPDHLSRWGRESSEILERLVEDGNASNTMFSIKIDSNKSKFIDDSEEAKAMDDILNEFF